MAPVADCLADESEVVFLRADRCGCLFGSWGLSKYAVAPSGVAASASWRLSWSRLWFSLSTSLRRSFSLCLILFFFSSFSSSFRACRILSYSAFFFSLSSQRLFDSADRWRHSSSSCRCFSLRSRSTIFFSSWKSPSASCAAFSLMFLSSRRKSNGPPFFNVVARV